MGLLAAPLLRAKLVYHNEGFYPDEQVDGGVWGQGSLAHRMTRWLERCLYGRSDGIIVLSEPARARVLGLPAVKRRGTPVIVVPSCVDLARFPARRPEPWAPGQTLRLVYVGSIGGRYRLDQIAEFASVARRRSGRMHLRVLTHAAPEEVAAVLRRQGLGADEWSVAAVSAEAVADELSRQHAGLFLLVRGPSEGGYSPTKVGEYWACGLPVAASANLSDLERLVREEKTGVIVDDPSTVSYERAVDDLLALLVDPDLAWRCRKAAERHYALDTACSRQLELYRTLLEDRTDRTSEEPDRAPPALEKAGQRHRGQEEEERFHGPTVS